MRFFSFTKDNTRSKHNEDSDYHIRFGDRHGFAVADGVTRTLYGENLPTAALASHIFCRYVATCVVNGKSMIESFKIANAAIRGLNEEYGITPDTVNYLDRDYISCVGVAACLLKGGSCLSYGYIGDCGIMIFDAVGMPVFVSENSLAQLEQIRNLWGYADEQKTLFWRKELRNNPGRRGLTFGALTGESAALFYVKTGIVEIQPGDTIVLFSDGIYPCLLHRAFRMGIRHIIMDNELSVETVDAQVERCLGGIADLALDDDKTFIAVTVS